MTTPGYSRAEASGAGNREPAAIIGLDLQTRTAQAMLRSRYTVNVNCSYAVGESIITPAIGEQWYVERFDMEWRLAGRIPHNDATLNIEPVAGQVSVGSATGPLELNSGSTINVNAPLNTKSVATTARPDPTSLPAGTQIYDSTLGKPIWSNGTVWHDAVGTTV